MMSLGWWFSVALFSVSMTGTPGPNNVMLTASGALYGYRRTLPHIFGIMAGCFALFMAVALGLGVLFERFPLIQQGLKIVGAVYLLYLAWKIATAPPPDLAASEGGRPLTAWQAATFQFVNPKAWVMGIALIAGFMPADGPLLINALVLSAFMEVIGFFCISCWAGFGMAIGRLLKTPRAWRVFNGLMGLATAACVGFIVT
ncbi:LysE family translocator [Salinicola rhizosphaerae]|uniref:Lysine transporter LysE n=1 Tax=Salinicola rhizosphaerae TaxID=1443141 RepID=A0ABQ3DSQ2_9GAMM|nr:LysE family translocator [Salinicola rhizosphaerae]GHB13395.1 lysine transporter LysE [Salinicola rhizosphaerae]